MSYYNVLVLTLTIIICKHFSESVLDNRNLNISHISDFNIPKYDTSRLDFSKFTEFSPKLIAFMLEVYNVKNDRRTGNFKIPHKSIKKIKKSDAVQHLTLEVSKRKKEKVFYVLPNIKNIKVMDMDILIFFNIHKFKLSRLKTSKHALNVGLTSKKSNFKTSNFKKLTKGVLNIDQCDKRSPTMYICWCIIDSKFSLNTNLFEKHQKNIKIYLTLELFNDWKEVKHPKSDLNSRKTLQLKDLIFKQSHLLVYSKSLNNSEMPKNDNSFSKKLSHLNGLLKKKESSQRLSSKKIYEENKRLRKRAFKSKKLRVIRKKDTWCRRKPLYVDFQAVGWNEWIVVPQGYVAYYCGGSCPYFLPDYMNTSNHAVIQMRIHSFDPSGSVPKPCCVPTKLSPLTLIYKMGKIMTVTNYKNMVVEACGCR